MIIVIIPNVELVNSTTPNVEFLMFLTIEIPVSYRNGKLINISKTEKKTIKIQCNKS